MMESKSQNTVINNLKKFITIPNLLEFILIPDIVFILLFSYFSPQEGFYGIKFSQWLTIFLTSFVTTPAIMVLMIKVYGYRDYRFRVLVHILIFGYAAAISSLCSPASGLFDLLDKPYDAVPILTSYSIIFIPSLLIVIGTIMNIFNITDPFVQEFYHFRSKVEKGDFTEKISNQMLLNDYIFKPIADLVNTIIDDSSTLLKNLSRASSKVSIASTSLTTTSKQVNSLSMEITGSVQEIARSAAQQAELSSKGMKDIENLSIIIDRSMQDIKNASKVISEIAAQTNILALNAAIEAARAGEYGRGFAVVADNVRRLAEETKTNATEIDSVIKDIIERVSSSVVVIQELFQDLTTRSEEFSATSEEVAAATEEQSALIMELDKSIEELKQLNNELSTAISKYQF